MDMENVIRTNGLALTPDERAAAEYVATRLNAKVVALYRTSTGLRAYVRDAGDGDHLGVRVTNAR